MAKSALIFGMAGQDGSYLAELLLAHGYKVHGAIRPGSADLERIQHLRLRLSIHPVDLLDEESVTKLIQKVQPLEVYNLAAQSSVAASWECPVNTADVTGLGPIRILEAIRRLNTSIRFCQATSSEMFGRPSETPQNERTQLQPRNPYGAAKVLAHFATQLFREAHNLFACSCILYNHESPRRGLNFVSRKITNAVARIKFGLDQQLALGNLLAARDWGFAGDHVRALWLSLQQPIPGDYVVGTGVTHTVQEFVELAFAHVGLDWRRYVVVDASLMRPNDSPPLVADSQKAHQQLDWMPEVSFEKLVQMMVDADVARTYLSDECRSVRDNSGDRRKAG